jgi:photosystem II stability/assembly factor-like uncharacterized protein
MPRRLCLAVILCLGLVCASAVCFAAPAEAAGTWTVRNGIVPSGDSAACVDFVDAQHGWIGLGSGKILATTDGGATWTTQTTGASSGILQVAMVDTQDGWARVWPSTVLRTTDGGAHWTAVSAVTGYSWTTTSLSAVSADCAWIACGGNVYRSTDGGATWQSSSLSITHVSALSETTAFTVGSGWIAKTTDGGAHWTTTYLFEPFFESPIDIQMFDSLHGVATAVDMRCTTRDGGSTWNPQSQIGSLTQCHWNDIDHGWCVQTMAVNGNHRIMATDDGSQTWFSQTETSTPLLINDIDVVGDMGWAAAGDRMLATQANGFGDMRPPVTTFTSSERVANHDLTVTLEASDNLSAASAIVTFYRVDGQGDDPYRIWNPALPLVFEVPADPKDEINHNVSVYSVDEYGNAESPHSDTYAVDTQAPTPKLTPEEKYQLDYWINTASFVTVDAVDQGPGYVAKIEFCRDKKTWVEASAGYVIETPAPKNHRGDGVFPIWVRATDAAGNVATPSKHAVCIDTRRPTTAAPSSASVRRGGTARLKFRINDKKPCGNKGTIAVVITNMAGTRRYKVVSPDKWFAKNRTQTVSFACNLTPGSYRFYVWAQDGAGNMNAKPARNTLYVH